MQRHRVEVVELFASLPYDGDKIGSFELLQMLCYGLARHVHVLAKLRQGLAVVPVQLVEQTSAAGVGQRFEYFVDIQVRQCQLPIRTSCGLGAPFPVSSSDFKLIRNVAHLVLQ
jgi:hypothetical protein